MYKKTLTLLAIFAMAGLLVSSCNNDDERAPVLSFAPNNVSVDDLGEEPIEIGGEVINPAVVASGMDYRFEQAWSSRVVQSEAVRFADYVYDPRYSYIVEGDYVPDSATDTFFVEVVTLAMKYELDSMERVGYISVIRVEDAGWVVQSSIVSFVQENYEEYVYIDEAQVWIKGFPPVSKRYNNPAASIWSWKTWLLCSAVGTAAGCGGAAVGCIASGPGYGACLAGGCAGSATAAMIGCALGQLL